MKIGIIGAGNIGGALTRRLCALGHEVSVANSRGPQTLRDLASRRARARWRFRTLLGTRTWSW
jgi:predicted dinucleotide-binding enzyme